MFDLKPKAIATIGNLLPQRCATVVASLTAAALALLAAPVATQAGTPAQVAAPPAGTLFGRFLAPPRASGDAILKRIGAAGSLGTSLPYWTTTITSPLNGTAYTVSMLGSSPYAATPSNTTIIYVPVVVRVNSKGYTFDPTATAHCDTQSAESRFFASPLFVATTYPAAGPGFASNGVNVAAGVSAGALQLESAFQRANFWQAVQGSAYGVTLAPSTTTPTVISYTTTNANDAVVQVASPCGGAAINLAEVSYTEWDALVQKIAKAYASPTTIPIVLTYDVAFYQGSTPKNGNCCILGYHNAVAWPIGSSSPTGTLVYAEAAYTDAGVFTNASDISPWSHELAEMIDDPFGQLIAGAPGGAANDTTPAWGGVGQVLQGSCQNNLEPGDPLTGTHLAITGANGFVYHFQDLAFHDWFFRTSPYTGAGAKGSFQGTFGAYGGDANDPQPACPA